MARLLRIELRICDDLRVLVDELALRQASLSNRPSIGARIVYTALLDGVRRKTTGIQECLAGSVDAPRRENIFWLYYTCGEIGALPSNRRVMMRP